MVIYMLSTTVDLKVFLFDEGNAIILYLIPFSRLKIWLLMPSTALPYSRRLGYAWCPDPVLDKGITRIILGA